MKPKVILLAICLISCLMAHKNSVAQICTEDSNALIEFFNSTDGPSWTYGSDWISNPGTFYGVSFWIWTGECSKATRINLPSNHIMGTIPESFGNLSELIYVDLWLNGLTGPIPTSIGNLTKLKELELLSNGLEGNIPPGIGNLDSLTFLDLTGNRLTGSIPDTLGSLQKIEVLSLAGNRLSGPIPGSFGKLSNLRFLDLNNNNIENPFPLELVNLHNLGYLGIGGNSFSGEVPSVIGNIISLTRLNINGRINGGAPQFSGTLPVNFGQLTNLQMFYASYNELSGEFPLGVLSKMTSLTHLDLSWNKFSGEIPAAINQLGSMVDMNLSWNEFTKLPSSIGNLGTLKNLNVAGNQIDHLPDEINQLLNLEIFDVSNNQISDLPDLSGMNSLHTLSVGDNRLDFDDLISALDYATYLNYYPQAEMKLIQTVKDGKIQLSMEAGGTLTTFQWFYSNVKIEGATQKSYTPEADKDLFKYKCEANNELFPYLTLTGRPSKGSPCVEFSVFEFCTEQEYWEKVEEQENQLATTGKVTINDLLNFEGSITIDTLNLTVKAKGEFYISDIPIPGGNIGKYTFSKGEYELKLLGEDGKITQFLNSKLDSVGELCGIDLKLSSLQLVGGRNATGIKMDCKIGIPGIAGSCGESDETKSEIEINGLEFNTSGIALEGVKITDLGLVLEGYCLKELALSYDSEKDIFTSGAKVNLPFGVIGGGIKMEKGALDSIAWHLEATKPPFVLGTTTIGIKGFYGHISNIVNPPYEIELGGIFTDVVIDELYLLDVKGKTIWPTVFEMEGNGKFMKPPLSEKPYQINGGIKMTYDHPMQMFALGLTGKIGTSDEETWLIDGKGELKLYTKFSPPKLVGSMEGKMTLEKFEDKFPYSWLNSLFSFPVVASTNCKMWWAQDRGIIGDATFEAENAGPYGLHYIFDLNKSYDQEGFLYWDATIEQKSAKIKSGSLIAETIETITIPDNTDFSVIGIISDSQATSSSLKNPAGKIYTNTDNEDNVLLSFSGGGKEGFWTIKNPMAGNWEITVQNPAENDSIFVFIQEKPVQLEISFTQNGNNVSVNWNQLLFSEEAEIIFQLDEDNTGFDGLTLAVGNANSGQISFSLNDSLSKCSYYLSAMVLDGFKLSGTYAERIINIEKPFLDPPIITDAFYNSNSDIVTVNFQNNNDFKTIGYTVDVIDEAGIDSTYKILMKGDNSFELFIKNIESKKITMTSFDYYGLKGCSSEEKSIITAVNEINSGQRKNNLIFYPNPTTGKGTIKFNIDKETFCKIRITDIYGRLTNELINEKRVAGTYNEEWDFGDLPNGLYLIILQTDSKLSSVKCILTR